MKNILYLRSSVNASNNSDLEGVNRYAKHLLEHSSKSITEIAAACGYGSATALHKVFAAETGKNPLAWRKRAE